MSHNYHKNNIFTGSLDAYCLVCEDYMQSKDEIEVHIQSSSHKENLELTLYCEKYKEDHIRKVKRGYYCVFCNILLSTRINVKLHVAEIQHNHNKISQVWSRVKDGVVAFERYFISDRAWNGFIDGTCFICAVKFQDENVHKSDEDHIINLINSKVGFIDNSLYRESTEGFQCLSCNKKFPLVIDTIVDHFGDPDHKTKLDKSAEYLKKPFIATSINNDNNIETDAVDVNSSSNERVEMPTIETTDVNDITDSNKNIPMDKHDPFSNVNYISNVNNNDKVHCLLCDLAFDNTSVLIGLHVNTSHHQILAKMHKERIKNMIVDHQDDHEGEKWENTVVSDSESKILDSLSEFQNNDININFETGSAVCKKCSKNLSFEFEDIDSHIKDHRNQSMKNVKQIPVQFEFNEKRTAKKGRLYTTPVLTKKHKIDEISDKDKKIANLTSEHNSTPRQNSLNCKSQDLGLPKVTNNSKALKEDVEPATHNDKTNPTSFPALNVKSTLKKVKMNNNFNFFLLLKSQTIGFLYIALDDKFVVSEYSFFMITQISLQDGHCYFCDTTFRLNERSKHLNTPEHLAGMNDVVVIESLDSELVREIRSGVFHCGFCNTIELDWNSLEKHINTTEHKDTKRFLASILLSSKEKILENMSKTRQKMFNLKRYCQTLLK